jgi:branched-chain amino acid transport system substrate-binding protein
MKRAMIVAACCAILGTLAWPFPSASQTATVYKIGLTFPLTGPLASAAAQYIPGAQIAVDEINRTGGVNGHLLQLAFEDTQASAQGGVAAMRKLVQVDGVQAIITIFTNVVTAQIPLADQLNVPTLSNILTPGVVSRSQYSFVHQTTMDSIGPVLSSYWRDHNVKRIYGVFSDNGFGRLFAPLAKAAAVRAGADFENAFIDLGTSDYRGVALRAREYRPDAIFVVAQGGDAETTAIRQIRESGSTVPIYDAPVFYQLRSWREAVGAYSEGMFFAGVAVPEAIAHDFIVAYRTKTGFAPDYNALQLYDMVKMYAAAIKKGGYNGEGIRNALASMSGVPSLFGGTITMGSDHYTVTSSVGLWQVRSGRLVRVAGSAKN